MKRFYARRYRKYQEPELPKPNNNEWFWWVLGILCMLSPVIIAKLWPQ